MIIIPVTAVTAHTGFISKFGPNVGFVIFLKKEIWSVEFVANTNQCKDKRRTGIF